MKNLYLVFFMLVSAGIFSCSSSKKVTTYTIKPGTEIKSTVVLTEKIPARTINTKNVVANDVVSLAESFLGYPYLWAGTSPDKGFDCSGLVFYCFKKFNISTPRVSKDFTNAGKPVSSLESKRGDIILFTGGDPNSGVVGHLGIITENNNGILKFVHSASGENGGVIISPMNSYFIPRFVKIIRVFKYPG
ncbi:MAG: C40 family peptidase [Ferruginibacter sp.]